MSRAHDLLKEIDRQIRRFTNESRLSRPFICDGLPRGCQVVQVGINPGTDTPFWPYWNMPTGFNKGDWLNHYMRKHGGKLGRTRRCIEILCQALKPLRCLELNLYHRFSKSEASLGKEHHDTALFDFMLKTVRPRVLVVHGRKPIKHLERLLGIEIEKDRFNTARFPGSRIELDVFAFANHFTRTKQEQVKSVGARIKARILKR
jgi:hypothetical protein